MHEGFVDDVIIRNTAVKGEQFHFVCNELVLIAQKKQFAICCCFFLLRCFFINMYTHPGIMRVVM